MIKERDWIIFVPDDGRLGLLWDVFERMPAKSALKLDWSMTELLVAAVNDVTAAVYLRLAFGGSRLTGMDDGPPILEPHEVLISVDQRRECEGILREQCHAKAEWFSVILVRTRTDAVCSAFFEAYRAVTGESPSQ